MEQRKRASVICLYKNKLLLVKLFDDVNRREFWSPPGGGIEPNEIPINTAARECLEETGVVVNLHSETERSYTMEFNWRGKMYLSTTTYYIGEYLQQIENTKPPEKYILESGFFDLPKAMDLLSEEKRIQSQVVEYLGLFTPINH